MFRALWILPTSVFFLATLVTSAIASPQLLFYHPFDGTLSKPAHAVGQFNVTGGSGLQLRTPAVRGKAAWFAETATEASLRINLPELAESDSWTVALWQILEVKEWLTAPDENLLTLLDAANKPIIKLSKSGGVFVYESGKTVYLDCFDALYWVQGSREHLALTWQPDRSGTKTGILRAYWKARPYAALSMKLTRRPVALQIGAPMAALAVDDLYVFDTALGQRSLWELHRDTGADLPALTQQLTSRELIEASRPTAVRRAAWARLAQQGIVVEAERAAKENQVQRAPVEEPDKNGWYRANRNPAATASGRACVQPNDQPLSFSLEVPRAGEYALALRYVLERQMHPLWPQGSQSKTPWTDNYTEIELLLDGKKLSNEQLYPTGSYQGHRGDVEPWAWHTIGTRKLSLAAGKHVLSVRFLKGLGRPSYDALLVSAESGPTPSHPRWVDQYRIPPAWWVAGKKTILSGQKRIDTYTITLRNRCDEPGSYEILADNHRIIPQQVRVSVDHITLKPFEEKSLQVVFESPASLKKHSGWGNIYLWNDDVSLRQKYRLWNLISTGPIKHPVLSPVPDPEMQTALRNWLKKRDPTELTPALKQWIRSRNATLSTPGQPVSGFPREFAGDRLKALDLWMAMTPTEIEQYLPDGPSEHNGYGAGWERMGIEYSGLWHKKPRVKHIAPAGDIDLVTSLTVEGPPQKGKTEIYRKTYVTGKDNDLIGSLRDTRWKSMMGHSISGAAPYRDTLLGRSSHCGITLLAEAYYLTGDKRYASKAFQMASIFARKYTGLTKHFNYVLNREDRDWWGGRIGGRYLPKFGPRYYHAMGIYVLDLLWDGLTAEQRCILEHNIVRWGMYEGMSGPLFEEPAYFAAVNKEDMPYLPMGRVLGDPAPIEGLQLFYNIFKGVVLDDGIHQCSIGSYGGVGGYVGFMETLHSHGLDMSANLALRNCFLAHPRFIFSGGGFPNIDDGGGVNLNGLGAGFGSPTPQQYAWAEKLYKDPRYGAWPAMIAAAKRVNSSPQENKAHLMRQEYLDANLPLEKLWPHLYIAPIKGMAILRNRTDAEPIDWKEVIFDYGLHGGRSHGHPAKLATIPSFNGQITSMEYGYGKLGELMSLYTSSYAHNVVVADARNQFGSSGAVPVGSLRGSFADSTIQWVDAESTRIYKGIEMRRTVFTTSFGIVDLHLCNSETSHQYDWMFHSFGEAQPEGLTLAPVKQLNPGGVLRFARNPRSQLTDGVVRVRWDNAPRSKPAKKESTALLHESAHVRVWALPTQQTTVSLYGIPMNESVGSEIDYLMLRRQGKATVFATVQEPWRASTHSKLTSIRRLTVNATQRAVADHDATALEIRFKDNSRQVFFVNYSGETRTIGPVTTDADVACWEISPQGNLRNPKHTPDATFKVR